MIYLYILAYSICIFYSMLESSDKYKERLVKISFLIFVYIILATFFYMKPIGAGFDDFHYNYVVNYQNNIGSFNPYHWGAGFMELISFSSGFDGIKFSILSLLVFSISFFCYSYSFSKLSPILSIPLLWYFSHYLFYKEFTQFRSAIAYSITLVGFVFLYKGKIKKYIFTILIASFFHISSIVAFLAYIALKLGKKKLFIMILISLFLAATNILTPLYEFIFKFFLSADAYKSYVLDSNGFASSLGLLNPTTLKYLVISLFFYYISDSLSDIKTFNFVLCVYMISPIWILTFSDFGTLAGRPASLFSVLEGCLFGHFVYYFKNKSIIIRLMIIFISILLLLMNIFIMKPINTDYLFF
ncbi:TPA: EpsG family protein [Photobacterium damselae]